MKELGIYVIYDKVAEEASQPLLAQNNEAAKRQVANEMATRVTENILYNVEDFKLVRIAKYDLDTATLTDVEREELDFSEHFALQLEKLTKSTQDSPQKYPQAVPNPHNRL